LINADNGDYQANVFGLFFNLSGDVRQGLLSR
jgi:hypothetical protein